MAFTDPELKCLNSHGIQKREGIKTQESGNAEMDVLYEARRIVFPREA